MSEKTLKTVVSALGVLILAYAVVALTSGGPGAGAGTGALTDALGSVTPEAVSSVRLESDDHTITLARADDGAWTVNGHPADSSAVNELWAALDSASRAELVSTNPANHGRFNVGEDAAWTVAFRMEGDEGLQLLVGDAGPYHPSTYIRLPEGDETYVVRGELRNLVERGEDDWRDKSVVRVDTSEVATVRVSRGDVEYTLERSDDGWTIDGEPANGSAVRDLLGDLATLDATGFAPDGITFSEPNRTLVALDAAGETLASIRLRAGEEFDTRLTVPGREAVFTLSDWRADRLVPARSEFAAESDSGGS